MSAKTIQPLWWAVLYFMIVILELFGEVGAELMDGKLLLFISKPLLMPALLVYFYFAAGGFRGYHKYVATALVFSWLGDVFLMPVWMPMDLFLYGLCAFLLAHLMYITAFRRSRGAEDYLRKQPIVILPVLLYGIGLVYSLYRYGGPDFKDFQFPVILYAGIILMMVLAALNRYGGVRPVSFQLVFWGALLFMFSDSLIAVNKFTDNLEAHPITVRLLIMSTYTLGQFLIVRGCVAQPPEGGVEAV